MKIKKNIQYTTRVTTSKIHKQQQNITNKPRRHKTAAAFKT